MRFFIYALGGGWGHLTRAAALARLARPAKMRILTNSPYAAHVRGAFPDLDLVVLNCDATAQNLRSRVREEIESADPDCLIVDTFPRGLGGELIDRLHAMRGFKALVQRALNPEYTAAANLTAFIEQTYDLVLIPGDAASAPEGPKRRVTDPWMVRSSHELPSAAEARIALRLNAAENCILICAAGNRDELAWYGEVAELIRDLENGISVRVIAPACPPRCPKEFWIPYWPAIDLYAAAGVLVGGGGYNTIHEAEVSGAPLICRPWDRKYDRQLERARATASRGNVVIVHEPEEAAREAVRLFRAAAGERPAPTYSNGAEAAFRFLRAAMRY
jgi:hypothetical protein